MAGLIVVLAASVAVIAFYNWKIFTGMRAGGYSGAVAFASLQVAVVLFCFTVWFSPVAAALYAVFPPLALTRLGHVTIYRDFLWPVLACALVVAGIVVVVASRVARKFSVGLSLAAFLAIVFAGSEIRSRVEMCAAAARLGVDQIKRNSFFWSMRNAPDEWQFGLHGYVEVDEDRFAWSYREVDWYELPETVRHSGVKAAPMTCGR